MLIHVSQVDNAKALLQQIIEDPHDITSRRVYADLMVESRNPIGRFIHLQCDLEGLGPYDQDRESIEAEVEKLLKKYRTSWGKALKQLATAVTFRRGFAESVSIKAERLLEVAPDLFRMAPIRSVKLCGDRAALSLVNDCSQLRTVEELSLSSMRLGSSYGLPLFSGTALRNVRSLNLGHNAMGVLGITPLLECPHLDVLESLNLDDNRLGTPGLAALAESDLLCQLRSLSLDSSRVTADGMVAVGNGNRLQNLTSLRAERSGLSDTGVRALARSDGFRP
ncbi:MAG: TIGR02996 domain-containing protein, partial [Rubripirellula sp.]